MFQPCDVKYAAVGVNLVELQAACFRHAKAVAEEQKDEATVARLGRR
jgi:hypothetical protein